MLSFVRTIKKAIRHPDKVREFALRKFVEKFLWNFRYAALREPKTIGAVPHDQGVFSRILDELLGLRLPIVNLSIEWDDYQKYMVQAKYDQYPDYYLGGRSKNFLEKSLEHYLAAKLLQLSPDDVYIDIAAAGSPVSSIYGRLWGCQTYRQDWVFPTGLHRDVIGGDASKMPVSDGFATKMAMHCSFEHFEGDSDIRFISEASRVLRRGGRLCILPLYLFERYAIQTDPSSYPKGGVKFEQDAELFCSKGWGERHGRFYDPPHLASRIISNLGNLRPTIYVVRNEKELDRSCYLKFVALFERE